MYVFRINFKKIEKYAKIFKVFFPYLGTSLANSVNINGSYSEMEYTDPLESPPVQFSEDDAAYFIEKSSDRRHNRRIDSIPDFHSERNLIQNSSKTTDSEQGTDELTSLQPMSMSPNSSALINYRFDQIKDLLCPDCLKNL